MRPTHASRTNSESKVVTRHRYTLHAIHTMMTIRMMSMFTLISMTRRQIIPSSIRHIPTSLQRLRHPIYGIKFRQTSLTFRRTRTHIFTMLVTFFGRRLRPRTSTRRQLLNNFFPRSKRRTNNFRLNRNITRHPRAKRSRPINHTSSHQINNSSNLLPRVNRTQLRTRRITRPVVRSHSRADDPFIRKVSSQ